MKKKKLIKIFLIILILLIICLVIFMSLLKENDVSSRESFEYIYSDEMKDGTTSPDMIHLIITFYDGEVAPDSISKSIYYFINTVIPKYVEKCSNEKKAEKYFDNNLEDVKLDINANKSEFVGLINEISKISGELKFESARFDKDSIKRTNRGIEALLYIKYENNPEISVRFVLLNELYDDRSSIKYYR